MIIKIAFSYDDLTFFKSKTSIAAAVTAAAHIAAVRTYTGQFSLRTANKTRDCKWSENNAWRQSAYILSRFVYHLVDFYQTNAQKIS